MNRSTVFVFVLVFVLATLYRIVPYDLRPEWLGAPQLALALFAGATIKRRGLAFLLPLASMLVSDVLMQVLHLLNPSYLSGFYQGQITNYLLILAITAIGFFINPVRISSILSGALASPFIYWLLSNFLVWAGGGGFNHPKTLVGLAACYIDALPFLKNSLAGTLIFSAVFFGCFALLTRSSNSLSTRVINP